MRNAVIAQPVERILGKDEVPGSNPGNSSKQKGVKPSVLRPFVILGFPSSLEKQMKTINTLIKWPGGKSREIPYIEHLIPNYKRYVEPFFGGGAMFFHLQPQNAIINDISHNLISFYELVKRQDCAFEFYLREYDHCFQSLLAFCDTNIETILSLYFRLKHHFIFENDAKVELSGLCSDLTEHALRSQSIILSKDEFTQMLVSFSLDKMIRTRKNEEKLSYNDEDLKENLITGFASGFYMYFRSLYNRFARISDSGLDLSLKIANFYFIREYCYGSMFRYNSKGDFNIPYGGMSYNRKDFKSKIDAIFNDHTKQLFCGTEITCSDFADFIKANDLREDDFMFLDPPYDTDFSDYEGRDFTKNDQKRLAEILYETKAKFLLIIKYTDYIYSLYEHSGFQILSFDKTYTYNVRSRNDRHAAHLIITNLQITM